MISPSCITSGYVFDVEIPAIRDRLRGANALSHAQAEAAQRLSFALTVPGQGST